MLETPGCRPPDGRQHEGRARVERAYVECNGFIRHCDSLFFVCACVCGFCMLVIVVVVVVAVASAAFPLASFDCCGGLLWS